MCAVQLAKVELPQCARTVQSNIAVAGLRKVGEIRDGAGSVRDGGTPVVRVAPKLRPVRITDPLRGAARRGGGGNYAGPRDRSVIGDRCNRFELRLQ